jgi:hypothetical protein
MVTAILWLFIILFVGIEIGIHSRPFDLDMIPTGVSSSLQVSMALPLLITSLWIVLVLDQAEILATTIFRREHMDMAGLLLLSDLHTIISLQLGHHRTSRRHLVEDHNLQRAEKYPKSFIASENPRASPPNPAS